MSSEPQSQPMSGLSALFSLSDAAATVPPMPVTAESSKLSKDSKDLASGKNGSHALKHRRLSSTGQTRRRMSDARDAVSRPNPASLSAASTLASLSALSLSPSGITSSVSPGHNLHSHNLNTRGRSHINISKQSGSEEMQDSEAASYETHPTLEGVASSLGSNGFFGRGGIASSMPTSSYVQDMASSVADDIEVDVEDFDDGASVAESVSGRSKSSKTAKVKKRGTIFQCESCSKVYRHPSCLVKHRWEHSPHWREASKFMLSKHQQVQMLEAATILSHLDPGSSLPEDRSHWPSFLSNGLLPPPSNENASAMNPQVTTVSARPSMKPASSSFTGISHPISSSVPGRIQAPVLIRNRSGSVTSTASGAGGPRMHDYTVAGGITQIRPGLLAHPTAPVVPTRVLGGTTVSPYADEELEVKDNRDTARTIEVISSSKVQPMSVPFNQSSRNIPNAFEAYRDTAGSAFSMSGFSIESGSVSASLAHSGGWSLPRSDLRSSSVARSFSGSRSGDEDDAPRSGPDGEDDDIDLDVDVADEQRDRFDSDAPFGSYSSAGFSYRGSQKVPTVKEEVDDEWADMDMDL